MSLNEQAVLDALKVIKDPDLHQDIVSLGFIQNLAIAGGKVAFDIELTTPACPVKDQFKTQAEAEVKKLSGVSSVEVKMTSNVRQASTGIQNLNMPSVRNLIAVASGKGGVGKSTVSANLALALAKTGAKVGLMDADVYGPSIPRMLGVMGQQPATDPLTKKMVPFEKHGIKFMSVGMLQADSDTALIWRGPMASRCARRNRAIAVARLAAEPSAGAAKATVIAITSSRPPAVMVTAKIGPWTTRILLRTTIWWSPSSVSVARAKASSRCPTANSSHR